MFNVQASKMRTPAVVRQWARNVRANGGGFEQNSMSIAANLVRILQTRSYYPKIRYLMPFLGSGVGAAITPLIDPSNLGSPTNVNFVNADFTQSTGLQGNGSDKRLAMPFSAGSLGGGNGGMGFWSLNVSVAAGTQYGMGAWDNGGTNTFGLRFGNGASDINCQFYWGGNSSPASLSELRSNSHYYGNRSSSTSRILYKNGTQAASDTSSDAGSGSSDKVLASYALNASSFLVFWGGSKGVEYYTDGTMSAADVADLHSVINSCLMVPAGRI